MRTAIMIGILLGMLGCGDNEAPATQQAAAAVTADAGSDATALPSADASTDSCVGAQGNCGCIFEETIHYGSDGPEITTQVVCP
jgi:hypothetical protein